MATFYGFGFKNVTITGSGKKCIDELLKLTNCNKEGNKLRQDVIVILDMHIKDISSLQVAKEIVNMNPSQQIIFTITMPPGIVRQEIDSIVLNNYDVLTKPFELSKLSSMVHRSITENK
jgi:DNA-binding NtrC family response regulator